MPLEFHYTNHNGVKSFRRVMPYALWYGKSKHHVNEAGEPIPQWFLNAFCLDRQEDRDFAWNDIEPVL